jgi:Ni,Fe-hydrogenase III small subunit
LTESRLRQNQRSPDRHPRFNEITPRSCKPWHGVVLTLTDHKGCTEGFLSLRLKKAEISVLIFRGLLPLFCLAGKCCEAEIVALTNPYYDLERFGIHFVASPKHADMLLVTGPVTRNMAAALKNAHDAVPSPKLVAAVGACGCGHPVDGYIPGCPPTPKMLLTGILQVLRAFPSRSRRP